MNRIKLDIQRFATSGTLTTPGNSDGTSFYFHWSRQSYSIAENKSTIYWQIGINAAYSYQSNAVKLGPTTVDGRVIHSGGTYSNISRGTHTMFEGTMDIYHNADGTKSFSASLSGWTWGSTWTSADNSNNPFVLNTIPRYATCTQSLNSKTETSIKMNWSSDSTIDYVWYSTNNGTNWTAVGSVNATSGSYTISGLTANTTYNIKTRVRRKDSQLTTDSSNSAIATYNYPNCTSAPNFTIGNSVTLQFYNPLNRTFDIRMWSHSASAFVSDSITISGTSYTFTPDASTLYASIPNSKSSVYNIDSTYNTHKIVKTGGSYSVNETTSKPTFSDFDYEDINSTTLALTGDSSIVVQNYSNVRTNISVANKAVANNSATMSRYNLVIGTGSNYVNYSDSEAVSVSLNGVSSNIINLYAEDSRGLTTLVSKTATLKAYTTIQKNEIKVERANNVGTGVTLSYNGTLWGESFGSVTNTAKSARYRFKKTNEDWGSTWNGTTTITPTTNGNNYSFTGGIAGDLGNTGFSAEHSFNIEVEVFDELSSTVFSFTLGTGIPLLAWGDDGLAIGQPYDDNDDSVLQVNGKTHLKGNTSITGDESISGNMSSGSFQGRTWDISTENTTDTWVPVMASGKWQHRVLNGALNNRGVTHLSSKTYVPYSSTNLTTVNTLAYWNGAYNSSNASNLTYAHQGTIQCKPTTLYSNDSGTNGTVTLSQTIANFTFIDISYRTNDGTNYVGTNRFVRYLSSANYSLGLTHINGNSAWAKHKLVTISGTTITTTQSIEYQLASNGTNTSNNLYITRVIGWK